MHSKIVHSEAVSSSSSSSSANHTVPQIASTPWRDMRGTQSSRNLHYVAREEIRRQSFHSRSIPSNVSSLGSSSAGTATINRALSRGLPWPWYDRHWQVNTIECVQCGKSTGIQTDASTRHSTISSLRIPLNIIGMSSGIGSLVQRR